MSWGEAQAAAKDRSLWRGVTIAVALCELCPTGHEEDK